MPRKPTTQPPPLESFSVWHGIQRYDFEVRDETCEVIGRGMHNVAAHNKQFSKALEQISTEYFWGADSKKAEIRSACRSDNALAIELALRGFPREERSLRKLASELRKELQILENALATQNAQKKIK
jgi:hypothetical protein